MNREQMIEHLTNELWKLDGHMLAQVALMMGVDWVTVKAYLVEEDL